MISTSTSENIQPIIFSAPFGNYLGGEGITSTLGSFTSKHRAGFWKRLWRVLKTVRFSILLRAWTNKLGLPNPGIAWLEDKVQFHKIVLKDKIVSLHGFSNQDWQELLTHIEQNLPVAPVLAFELNFSCPNIQHEGEFDYKQILEFATSSLARFSSPIGIVKVPPVGWEPIVRACYSAGIRWFHCCNTLPVKRGSMSGKPLKPIVLEVVRKIARDYSGVHIIAGGGITCPDDIKDYHDAGARHFAIASGLFNPLTFLWARSLARSLSNEGRNLFE